MKALTLVIGLALLPLTTIAKDTKHPVQGGSDGTRGGGEIVWTNGYGRLRDLVDPSVCENKKGTELRQESSEIDNILNRLAKLDWYFAAGLKREINQLDICFTKTLMRLQNEDWDSVIVYKPRPKDQVAIRYLYTKEVYVNSDLYAQLPYTDRAYLIVHEAMHNFVPLNAPMRNGSVRLAVKTIERVVNGEIRSAKKLHAELNRASVAYPWSAAKLREYRAAIEFALSDVSEQHATILNSSDVDGLFTIDHGKTYGYLFPEHQAEICKNPAQRAADLLDDAGNDTAVLNKIVNSHITAFDPLMVAFSTEAATEDENYQSVILNSLAMKKGPNFFDKMVTKRLALGEYRIVGLDGYNYLGIPGSDLVPTPALAVRPYSITEIDLVPSEVIGFTRFIGLQAKRGPAGWNIIRRLVTENDAFYAAFEVRSLKAQLEAIQPQIAREKTHLLEAIPELVRGLRIVMYYSVKQVADQAAADQLDLEINWARLGL